MMKKLIRVLAAAFLTVACGCAEMPASLQERLDIRVENSLGTNAPLPNYNHKYYAYYAEPTLGRIDSHTAGNTFSYNGTKFVMNLKIADVINGEYYSDTEAVKAEISGTPAAGSTGSYTASDGSEHPYAILIYRSEDGSCLISLQTDAVEAYAVSAECDAADVAGAMLRVAKSVKVDHDEVVAAFSNRQDISYNRKPIELFQFIAPESGAIAELFPDNTTAIGEVSDLQNYESYQSLDYSKRRIESDEYDYYQFIEEDR